MAAVTTTTPLTARSVSGSAVGAMTALMGELEPIDPATLDIDSLDAARAKYRRLIGWAQAQMLACTRRQGELADQGRAEDPALSLLNTGGQSTAEAKSTVDQAELCNHHSELSDSLAAGDITTTYLAAIARFRSRLNAEEQSEFDTHIPEIHNWARTTTVAVFESRLRRLVAEIRQAHRCESDTAELDQQRADSHIKSWVDRDTGMHKHLLVMDPIRSAKFNSALLAELAALRSKSQSNESNRTAAGTGSCSDTYGSLQIEALLQAMSGGKAAQRATELIVLVDHDTLTTGVHPDTICETLDGDPVPASIARSMVGDAHLTVLVADAHGGIHEAIDERTASRAQRRALAGLYRTCAFPGCDVPFSRTRMHHVIYYRHHGKTKLANLLPLCERHHHWIHDLGWHLVLDPTTRRARFHPPNNPDRVQVTVPDRGPPGRAGP